MAYAAEKQRAGREVTLAALFIAFLKVSLVATGGALGGFGLL